jgi:S1-C subfamily serine protease
MKTKGFKLLGLIAITLIVALSAGGILSYLVTSQRINDLENQVSAIQNQLSNLQPAENNIYHVLEDNISLSKLYDEVKNSVVVIQGVITQTTIFGLRHQEQVQGSGFVYDHEGQMIIITNFHVVDDATNITVTFMDGNAYAATVLGSDPYADLAALLTEAPESEFKPLQIVSSSTLEVGDPVVAIGNPFGLTGSMTVGIVSQLGRTITESTTGGFSIANIIQTTAPINSGNSGGPLLNYQGQVVGITTAIVADSQGLGFAVPSNTILREIGSLVETRSYTQHPWLGVSGTDMNYEIAELMDTDFTYGWLITQVANNGPADKAGLRGGTEQAQTVGGRVIIGGDIIIAIEGTRIVNGDDLSTYLEEHTLPGQTVEITIVRENQTMILPVELGTRPPP